MCCMLSIIKAALGPCAGCLGDFNKKLVIGLLPWLTVAFRSICGFRTGPAVQIKSFQTSSHRKRYMIAKFKCSTLARRARSLTGGRFRPSKKEKKIIQRRRKKERKEKKKENIHKSNSHHCVALNTSPEI